MNAKQTIFGGQMYKSRLEASFACWLTERDVLFGYESGHGFGTEQYVPDFSVVSGETLDCRNAWIEIKPICFYKESWLAIRAAQECGKTLFVLDSPERGIFAAYVVVREGELVLFSKDLAFEFFIDFHPLWWADRFWQRVGSTWIASESVSSS